MIECVIRDSGVYRSVRVCAEGSVVVEKGYWIVGGVWLSAANPTENFWMFKISGGSLGKPGPPCPTRQQSSWPGPHTPKPQVGSYKYCVLHLPIVYLLITIRLGDAKGNSGNNPYID